MPLPERSVKRTLSVLQRGLGSWWRCFLCAQSYIAWAVHVRQQWSWHTHFGLPHSTFPLLMEGHGERDGDTKEPFLCCPSWGVASKWGRELRRQSWVSCDCQIKFSPLRACWYHRQGYYTFATSIFMYKLNTSDTCVLHGNATEVNSWCLSLAVHSLPHCHYRCIHEVFHTKSRTWMRYTNPC